MMKRSFTWASLAALLVAGVAAALLVAAPPGQAKAWHVGSATLSCTGVVYSFTSFPNQNSNKVHVIVKVDGHTTTDTTVTFNGSTSPVFSYPSSLTSGTHTIQASASWNTNGASGSYDSGVKSFNCSQPCVPVTVTITTPAVTVPGSTTTVAGQTVTTPPVTVTTPAVTVTRTVTSKPRIITRVKWRTKTRVVVKWRTPTGLICHGSKCGFGGKG